MNNKVPEEIRLQMTVDDAGLAQAWNALGAALPDAPSARLKRQLRRTVRLERSRQWMPALAMAGVTVALVAGIAVGRFSAPAVQVPADINLQTRLLSGGSSALKLEAMVGLRRMDSELPMAVARQLAQIVASDQVNVGLRLAAAEVMAAHSAQLEVQALIQQLLGNVAQNQLINARLKEASSNKTTATI